MVNAFLARPGRSRALVCHKIPSMPSLSWPGSTLPRSSMGARQSRDPSEALGAGAVFAAA